MTQHGVLQANRLGQHFADRGVKVSSIFSSDLQRAFKTAEAVRAAQPESSFKPSGITKLLDLREQDFGFYEGKVFYERPKDSNKSGKEAHLETHRNDPGFKDVESKDAMKIRSDHFIDQHLVELLSHTAAEHAIVIVAHGIILAHLWRCILRRFSRHSVSIAQGAASSGRELILEYLGGWSNTGYLELEIVSGPASTTPLAISPSKRKRDDYAEDSASPGIHDAAVESTRSPPPMPAMDGADEIVLPSSTPDLHMLPDFKLTVKVVNCLEHLKGLKKTRGGIGSAKHDDSQKTIQSFFKKKKTD